ncbi:MAG: 16S rRNA (adenine(1518)-N(6)/adenine(1519)-N(6))-dimethyltransferase RsmA [Prolixibacteraceae bacterium]|nr:16S rRNA (adenine(1518)-N(6)/adenine(1519)-N(6))-dimethyltransferase RsmA [Prolixibacteraceae bacterium]
MTVVKAKKNLGQHFLTDLNTAGKIVGSLSTETPNILEIGPGMGVLTQILFQREQQTTIAMDIDRESVAYLKDQFPNREAQILEADFLRYDLHNIFGEAPFVVIGNFPYNISSQIFFKVLDFRNQIPEVVGMIQKEVAERLAAPPGSKTYGILSVLLQAYYQIDYLFTVHEHVFSPPPKVKSAVIRLTRNQVQDLGCDEVLFKKLVKTCFNQRRKMIRNTIKMLVSQDGFSHPYLTQRPEQLSVSEFVELTNALTHFQNQ